MPLVTAHQLVDRARAESRGVGAFNVIQVEHAEAFVAA
ncbi:fructose-bisphosphate aldolase, partial [Actinotalea fermentans ATCC 43279 = JCM 9966 = DSM 3133]